jgi:DNA-binding transcriptional LysR family regulator
MVLRGVTGLVNPIEPDLFTMNQVVRLIMTDYPAVLLVRTLLQQLRESAPGINLVVLQWHGADDAVERLCRHEADIAVSLIPPDNSDIRRSQLFYETYRIVMRHDHPAANDFDLDQWLAYPHVVISGRGERFTPVDDILLGLGRQRHIGIVVPSFLMAAPIIAASDLIAMLPTRCIPEGRNFVTFDPPVAVSGFPLHIAWHRRSDSDIAIRHVSDLIRTLCI